MKKYVSLHLLLVCHILSFSQVGIGTTTPNSKSILELNSTTKGLLLPRFTSTDRADMNLTSSDAGMMVFQTFPNKGSYMFDGANWFGLAGSTVTGATLRWDGDKEVWTSATNLFNQGSSIGIGTMNPKAQLHINSITNIPTTRIQITNATTGNQTADGLVLGVSHTNNEAHVINQENKALIIGTNASERLRIDSAGNIGINNPLPEANLDVHGTVKVGEFGTALSCIMKASVMVDLPLIPSGLFQIVEIPCPNVQPQATVHISPGENMEDLIIGYARVSSPGVVEIKFVNLSIAPVDQGEMMFYMTMIQ